MKISPRKWSTKAVEEFLRQIQSTGVVPRYSPFHNGDTSLRGADLTFTYTQQEMDERAKVAANIFYFATTYAKVLTDDGIVKIKHLRDYQKRSLSSFVKHLRIVWLASRQIGKTCGKFTSLRVINDAGVEEQIPIYALYYAQVEKSLYNRFMCWLHDVQYSLFLKINS